MNRANILKEKYKIKIAELDKRMEELKALEYTDDIGIEMMSIMSKTNKYLKAIGADKSEMYDL